MIDPLKKTSTITYNATFTPFLKTFLAVFFAHPIEQVFIFLNFTTFKIQLNIC